MNKQDIIDQWHEDQKPVAPEALGWGSGVIRHRNTVWIKGKYQLTHYKHVQKYVIDLPDTYNTLFDGDMVNQGQLRMLMNMLNIK